jgi:hypothetical protein
VDDRIAPEGWVWICFACGKRSKDVYGEVGSSWDESCMLNSRLVEEKSIRTGSDGRIYIEEGRRPLVGPDGKVINADKVEAT